MPETTADLKNCCIRLNHIPYGFFEKELFGYFSQFGRVVRVRVPKSKRGLFKNKAYILFDDKEVARLASEAMDNYLMYDKRVRCSVIKDRVPNVIKSGPTFAYHEGFEKNRKHEALHNARERTNDETKLENIKIAISLRSALKKLKEAGYEYEFDFSAKEKKALTQE
ncbi:unnamed protein product [Bursaphelenchus xylophilus]|uniref:(pine wood nematode) hypothetical protein n=1 Tax=Bursaphelenchus xylophilus TaxID=6326 RepID=A0A1I7RRZ8_BURXY|nr:unnamed protein product [Bursaphelenchus xylophilus]CAG9123357.1 unnamed protein product [Bursaphelenchus xylophilus]